MLRTRNALPAGRINRPRPPATPIPQSRPQTCRTLWYALHFPELTQAELISELAAVCQAASPHICMAPPDTLVLEVRSMLRYFGSFQTLKTKLQPLLQEKLIELEQPCIFSDALSPSAAASVLLARAGADVQIRQMEGLKSALGKIPVAMLPLNKKLLQRLHGCGLLYLRDIWRLPSAALRVRFGRELAEYLEQLLAQRYPVLQRWQPDVVFCENIEVDEELSGMTDILWLGSKLLQRMETFLKSRQLATDRILFRIFRYQLEVLVITLHTRTPGNDGGLWKMLLENRLQQIQLDCAITGVSLKVLQFYPAAVSGACPSPSLAKPQAENGLLEILAARLGDDRIFQLYCRQSHDPAVAGKYLGFRENENSLALPAATAVDYVHWKHTPCWLLAIPKKLHTSNGIPIYMTPLEFDQGPQRIESCWWTGSEIRRDYYIAHNHHGMMLWIYRDLENRQQQNPPSWFLHGLFA